MRIDVILTGGTIGSVIGASGEIGPVRSDDECKRIIDPLLHGCKTEKNPSVLHRADGVNYLLFEEIRFVISEPYRILSEDITSDNILKLADEIRRLINCGSEGIIITHGTDTIQYTASLLQYIFGDARIPIVIVSAAYILEDPRSNGQDNFRCAVSFVKNRYGTGVFVSYRNCVGTDPGIQQRNCFIHRGNRLLPHAMYTDALYSVCDSYYGKYVAVSKDGKYDDDRTDGSHNGSGEYEHVFEKNPAYKVREGNIDSIRNAGIDRKKGLELSGYSNEITVIKAFPGMCLPEKPNGSTKVVLIEGFHSGTIPTGNKSLKAFCDSAKHMGIPVYLTGLPENEKHYETTAEYESLGITPLKTISSIAAYCKLWLILSNGLDMELMNEPIAEDMINY